MPMLFQFPRLTAAAPFNPGALPDPRYFSELSFGDTLSLTVIFKDTYGNWMTRKDALVQATQSYDHAKLALILHSVPKMSGSDTARTFKKLLSVGYSIWLTGTNDYTVLDSYFSVFVDGLDAMLSSFTDLRRSPCTTVRFSGTADVAHEYEMHRNCSKCLHRGVTLAGLRLDRNTETFFRWQCAIRKMHLDVMFLTITSRRLDGLVYCTRVQSADRILPQDRRSWASPALGGCDAETVAEWRKLR
ncbi:hypothetical protein K458DRAFT_164838 [Lentithecium fluviatile CBS 122367]|uniref:Uncharacterized protein n=1 Tax=Lentithecium fluviatile CBS 122367 TaxID=1168545 RepID=A0A6G1IFP8_9PLEO|nr:hypothetical protein K458DRAFT_164838 [Lentithecium fluviatile CBS 122367]